MQSTCIVLKYCLGYLIDKFENKSAGRSQNVPAGLRLLSEK
jgi:ferredoxin